MRWLAIIPDRIGQARTRRADRKRHSQEEPGQSAGRSQLQARSPLSTNIITRTVFNCTRGIIPMLGNSDSYPVSRRGRPPLSRHGRVKPRRDRPSVAARRYDRWPTGWQAVTNGSQLMRSGITVSLRLHLPIPQQQTQMQRYRHVAHTTRRLPFLQHDPPHLPARSRPRCRDQFDLFRVAAEDAADRHIALLHARLG